MQEVLKNHIYTSKCTEVKLTGEFIDIAITNLQSRIKESELANSKRLLAQPIISYYKASIEESEDTIETPIFNYQSFSVAVNKRLINYLQENRDKGVGIEDCYAEVEKIKLGLKGVKLNDLDTPIAQAAIDEDLDYIGFLENIKKYMENEQSVIGLITISALCAQLKLTEQFETEILLRNNINPETEEHEIYRAQGQEEDHIGSSSTEDFMHAMLFTKHYTCEKDPSKPYAELNKWLLACDTVLSRMEKFDIHDDSIANAIDECLGMNAEEAVEAIENGEKIIIDVEQFKSQYLSTVVYYLGEEMTIFNKHLATAERRAVEDCPELASLDTQAISEVKSIATFAPQTVSISILGERGASWSISSGGTGLIF